MTLYIFQPILFFLTKIQKETNKSNIIFVIFVVGSQWKQHRCCGFDSLFCTIDFTHGASCSNLVRNLA